MLNDIQKSILQTVSDMVSIPDGAVNIRLRSLFAALDERDEDRR